MGGAANAAPSPLIFLGKGKLIKRVLSRNSQDKRPTRKIGTKHEVEVKVKIFKKILVESVRQLISLEKPPEVIAEKAVAIARLTYSEMQRQGVLKRKKPEEIPEREKISRRQGGKLDGWLYWIYPCDTYPDGYSPCTSPLFLQVCSRFGDEWIKECDSLSEATATLAQLAKLHPNGQWDWTQPSFEFRQMTQDY